MTRVVGLTGTMSAGKGFISTYLKQCGFAYISLSDMIREECKQRGIENWTRKDLQTVANEMRLQEGPGVLGKRARAFAQQQTTPLIVDSIRNPEEIKELRKCQDFILIGIDAPQHMRFERRDQTRSDNPDTFEEFQEREAEEAKGASHAQQVHACLEMADLRIWNDTNVDRIEDTPFFQKIKELILPTRS